MLITTLELRFYLDSEDTYFTVGRYFFNPDFEIGDEMEVYWTETDDELCSTWNYHQLKVKVVDKKTEIYKYDDQQLMQLAKTKFHLNNSVEELMNTGVMNLRVFVEAEDRDLMVEISEQIKNNN
ncbi:hypothetical protein [Cyanobacterium aponinum]|uniref:Uncharacterized protein n=1 Tax=Cyanobacterium aponinum 0216 TaxID=2676140 RepID=A0A844GWU5_9CHRO|nr:hypothetical protein [Cyanobacterium aponinum]MTF40033.1 hypothetical protein [Cyanobacterium aponinum 0216]